VQRQVGTRHIVVSLIRLEQMAKVPFAKNNHVVEAISSDRTDEPLRVSILPWRTSRGRSIPNAQGSNAPTENLAVAKRLVFSNIDRLVLVNLYRFSPKVLDALAILKPATVIAWHRAGFRAYWRWKSRPLGGRPTISCEIRKLIREMILLILLIPCTEKSSDFHSENCSVS
jgi:hypothetical protein